MPDEIRTRFHAQGVSDYGGGITQSVNLADVSSLNLSLRPGDGESWQQFYKQQVISPGGNYDLDLNNPSNAIKDGGNNPLEIESLRWFVVSIVSPDGTKIVRYGPQNVTSFLSMVVLMQPSRFRMKAIRKITSTCRSLRRPRINLFRSRSRHSTNFARCSS